MPNSNSEIQFSVSMNDMHELCNLLNTIGSRATTISKATENHYNPCRVLFPHSEDIIEKCKKARDILGRAINQETNKAYRQIEMENAQNG